MDGKIGRALAFEDDLGRCVERMLLHSPIVDKVSFRWRSHVVNPSVQVLEIEDTTLYGWSTGEELVWAFLSSLCGQGAAPISAVAAWYRGSELAPWMSACVDELFGIEPELPPDPASAALPVRTPTAPPAERHNAARVEPPSPEVLEAVRTALANQQVEREYDFPEVQPPRYGVL